MKLSKLAKVVVAVIALIVLGIIGLIIKQSIVDFRINNDYSEISLNEKYSQMAEINDFKLVKQDISCGYACIEMMGNHLGNKISEEELFSQNDGRISTAMGNGFCNEMNKQFTDYNTTKHKNLTNTMLIDMIYQSLAEGMPVTVEFAAKYYGDDDEVWTLHFAIVTAIDVPDDTITVYNPYGYIETYTLDEFLMATRYDSYENMPLYLKLGFAVGIFNRNTIYIIE